MATDWSWWLSNKSTEKKKCQLCGRFKSSSDFHKQKVIVRKKSIMICKKCFSMEK